MKEPKATDIPAAETDEKIIKPAKQELEDIALNMEAMNKRHEDTRAAVESGREMIKDLPKGDREDAERKQHQAEKEMHRRQTEERRAYGA